MAVSRDSRAVAAVVMGGALIAGLVSPYYPNLFLLGGVTLVTLLAGIRLGIVAVLLGGAVAIVNLPQPTAIAQLLRGLLFVLTAGGLVGIVAARRAHGDASAQHRVLFDEHPLPMWLHDPVSLQFLDVNRQALEVYGYSREEFAAMRVPDLHPPPEREAIEQRPAGEAPQYRDCWTHQTKHGRTMVVEVFANLVEWRGRPVRLVMVEDITERRELEAQLRQAQKMEAVGQLAGGIAHDFNNLLTAIRGYADLLTSSLQEDDRRRMDALEILAAAERASALTRQLLAFSRKQIMDVDIVRVSDVVQDIAPMIRRLVDESIDVVTITRDRGHIKADPTQLQQILMNLVVNARDAISGSGRITIETADVELDQAWVDRHRGARPGWHVMLAVSDTGAGMDADTQGRIFEPFFTTKGGRGTGLGLSTVYGIVKQTGGYIAVSSTVGHGATFQVYLPRTDEHACPKPSQAVTTTPPHGGTILLLEDEASVRKLVLRVLTQYGFAVHAAGTPGEALALAQERDLRFDLLLTDIVLPEMSGREVATAFASYQPACRVLFISGYTDDAIVRHGVLDRSAPFLHKPFTAEALVQKIGEVLSRGAEPA